MHELMNVLGAHLLRHRFYPITCTAFQNHRPSSPMIGLPTAHTDKSKLDLWTSAFYER